jgi:hypothetical protein
MKRAIQTTISFDNVVAKGIQRASGGHVTKSDKPVEEEASSKSNVFRGEGKKQVVKKKNDGSATLTTPNSKKQSKPKTMMSGSDDGKRESIKKRGRTDADEGREPLAVGRRIEQETVEYVNTTDSDRDDQRLMKQGVKKKNDGSATLTTPNSKKLSKPKKMMSNSDDGLRESIKKGGRTDAEKGQEPLAVGRIEQEKSDRDDRRLKQEHSVIKQKPPQGSPDYEEGGGKGEKQSSIMKMDGGGDDDHSSKPPKAKKMRIDGKQEKGEPPPQPVRKRIIEDINEDVIIDIKDVCAVLENIDDEEKVYSFINRLCEAHHVTVKKLGKKRKGLIPPQSQSNEPFDWLSYKKSASPPSSPLPDHSISEEQRIIRKLEAEVQRLRSLLSPGDPPEQLSSVTIIDEKQKSPGAKTASYTAAIAQEQEQSTIVTSTMAGHAREQQQPAVILAPGEAASGSIGVITNQEVSSEIIATNSQTDDKKQSTTQRTSKRRRSSVSTDEQPVATKETIASRFQALLQGKSGLPTFAKHVHRSKKLGRLFIPKVCSAAVNENGNISGMLQAQPEYFLESKVITTMSFDDAQNQNDMPIILLDLLTEAEQSLPVDAGDEFQFTKLFRSCVLVNNEEERKDDDDDDEKTLTLAGVPILPDGASIVKKGGCDNATSFLQQGLDKNMSCAVTRISSLQKPSKVS